MELLRRAAALELITFVGGLAALTAWQLLSGQINTRWLLYGRTGTGTQYLSPERIQLLAITVGTLGTYLLDVLNNPHRGALPDVPQSLLATFGASNLAYLAGKAVARIRTDSK
ncbi:MAG: hypothetical protein OSA97_01060 [Nevskia sp.]|nr:hypothetical protein [Nevskia sp.]